MNEAEIRKEAGHIAASENCSYVENAIVALGLRIAKEEREEERKRIQYAIDGLNTTRKTNESR